MRSLTLVSIISLAVAQPACVVAPNGKMLCCPQDDATCIAKIQAAHEETPTPPAVTTPKKPGMMGSMQTFANSTLWNHINSFDVAVVGVPFGLEPGYDAPGLQLVRRETSRMLPYSRTHESALEDLNVVDGQDLLLSSASRGSGQEIELNAVPFFSTGKPLLAIGGDQSITVPLLRAAKATLGDFAIVHIDKDMAIGSGSREEELSKHSALFWAAASSLVDTRHSIHVGLRGNLPSRRVELIDQELGYQSISAEEMALMGINETVQRIRTRLQRRDGTFMPAYLSLDLDVLDPVYFPASEESGGLSVVQLRALIMGLRPFCRVVCAEIRGVAALESPGNVVRTAATLAYDLALLAGRQHLLGTSVVPPQLRDDL
eukprot:TRINITY_DN67049_c0_g1_i1.p1 TRINITY_DN67049_c0_g1~~TRINITY_DN67049_c0_g1_i1.p1  ORF type:complete len:374 (-),score=62.13 TRINITY_DN67049_c0_g1_i1:211-1332(-)